MTKKQKAQAEAVQVLKDWGIVDGTLIYAKVCSVSSSGMSRRVQLFAIVDGSLIDISYWSAKALEWGYKEGYNKGILVGGCGMDMLFHTVYSLSYAMGYGALNQGRDHLEGHTTGLRYKSI